MTETVETPIWRPDPFPLPDFAALVADADRRAPDMARRSGVSAAHIMLAGYEPPGLGVICDERADALARLAGHISAQRDRAEVLLREHERAAKQRADHLADLSKEYQRAKDEVRTRSQRSSQQPGDGYADEVAISGGIGRRLARDLPPLLLLVALLGVEIPIYFETFLDLGDNVVLTTLFAIAAMLVLGLGPHLYGRKFRAWQEEGTAPRRAREFTPRDWLRPSPMTLLPAVWLIVIVSVAVMRVTALTKPRTYTSSTGEPIPLRTISDGIGVVPTFILLLALMIFTAMIAVESGRRMANPNNKRLRDARVRLREVKKEVDEAQRLAVADEHRQRELERFLQGGASYQGEYAQRIISGYERVEKAYVDSFLTVPGQEDPRVSHFATVIMDNHRARRH